MSRFTSLALLAAAVLGGCFVDPSSDDVVQDFDVDAPYDCAEMFAQDLLPEWHVELSATEMAAIEDEFYNRQARIDAGLDPTPYHPATVTYAAGSELTTIPNAVVRLKGASSWVQAIDLDEDPKMQFVLAFNEIDPNGRFQGVRKVVLDMPRSDRTFIQQRVALSYLREAGLPAQCGNNARLVLNGEYYGLYSHLERQDKEFLQRLYGDDDEGDLWESGRIIKTNEETFTWDRLDELWNSPIATFNDLADEDAAYAEWAGEAVVGDADGYYNGRANFYLYDHPDRGFIWIPSDLDTVLDWDFLSPTAPPVAPPAMWRWERDWYHYLMAIEDDAAIQQYVGAVAEARAAYDPTSMMQRIDAWSAQVAASASEDPHKPFTDDDHAIAVMRMRMYPMARSTYLDQWLGCWSAGGADADGDGFDMCHDCNDASNDVNPGAVEACNLRDDDCDGRVDSVNGATICE